MGYSCEFAKYRSLKCILQKCNEDKSTLYKFLQERINITIDIAEGLNEIIYALILHRDLKKKIFKYFAF